MADTYVNRQFSGNWENYKRNKPAISFTFTGYTNGGGNVGCKGGTTGDAAYTMTVYDSYEELWNVDGIHAKCCIAAWFNGSNWILSPIGFPSGWNTFTNKRKDMLKNGVAGVIGRDYHFVTSAETNTPELVFRNLHDEYPMFNFNNEEIGTKVFGAELNANCPIIQTDTNRNLVLLKDGSKVPLNASVLYEDIDPSAFLNGHDLEEDPYTEYYIYTKAAKYDVDGNGNKTNVHEMQADSQWVEFNSQRLSAPYLVETEFNGIPCLKLFGTFETSETEQYEQTFSAFSSYGNGAFEFTFKDLYKSVASISSEHTPPDYAILKNLGYYYYENAAKKVGLKIDTVQIINFETNIPIFADESKGSEWSYERSYGDQQKADELLKENALNDTESDDKFNPIGDELNETTIDEGYTQQAMSTQYALDTPSLVELANNLFNTDVSVQGALTDGLKLYGANPINCVIDLQYYPFDVPAHIQNSPENYIYFGSYKMDFTNSFDKLYNTKCVIECGSVIYPEQTGTYLDYEPYTELYIYLPYVGVQKLDVNTYNGKVIDLKYIVDIQTGMCEAVLFADNIIRDNFSGNMGAKQCISSIDYASYAQKKGSNLYDTVNNMIKFGEGGLALAKGGFGAGADAASALFGFEKGMFNLYQTQNAQHISIRGSVTPTTAFAMPQYAYFYTVKQDVIFPNNEQALIGYPSNTGGKVRNFKGFLQCSQVSINTTATESEKAKLYALLKSGIYI